MGKQLYKIKYYIKTAIAFFLYYSGILFVLKNIILRNKAVVLTYHRILPYSLRNRSFSHEAIMVDPVSFDRQMCFLKKHFRLLDTEEFVSSFENNSPFQNASCLITFDDGWKDNYDYALPILQKYDIHALIFPAIDYIGTGKLFWQEEMGHGFHQALKNYNTLSETLEDYGLKKLVDLPDEELLDSIRDHVRGLKSLPYDQIQKIMHTLSISGVIDHGDVDVYLDWELVREMHNSVISFGSHACSHRILTRLDDDEINEELARSRKELEQAVGHPITTIAYPNGNYDERLGELARSHGYKLGFGTEFGSVSHTDEPMNLRRININDSISRNEPIMLATILGIF